MSLILYTVKDRLGYITLNRPDKRNALSHELISELIHAIDQAEMDDKVKAVILNAEGESFCAGADLAYLQQLQQFSFEQNLNDSKLLRDLYLKIYQCKKVVIAQVQGHALAGGCGLATICDFAFAVPEAKFGYTEVKIGFVPALVSVFLIRKIGEGRAKQLLLTGDIISAESALEVGLINQIVERSKLEQAVYEFASTLIQTSSGQSIHLTKQIISQVQTLPLEAALEVAATMNANARATDDCKRGIAAFLNKQKLKW